MGVTDEQNDRLASVSMTWAGQTFTLRPEGGLHWPARDCLIVADTHFGKAEHFRRSGVPVPGGTTGDNLRRLDAMLDATGARRLIVLGDLLHARDGVAEPLTAQLADWRARHDTLTMLLVRGNHDAHAGPAPASLAIEDVGETWREGALLLRHEPMADEAASDEEAADDFVMAGHVHPAVRLHGIGMRSEKLPCFHFGARQALLPAFGAFTGMHPIRPRAGDGVYAIGPEGVFHVPTEV